MRLQRYSHEGLVILPIIIILPFLILIATYFLNLSVASFRLAARDQHQTHAQLAADAAVDVAMEEINQDTDYAGTGSQVEIVNDGKVCVTYESSIATNGPESETITATGRTYRPAGACDGTGNPQASVTVKVDIRPITSGGTYSLVTGAGGLLMENSAKIVGGAVKVNGEVELKNTAQIGLTTNSLVVEVAHQSCPIGGGSTFPQLCTSGNGEPISILDEAHIYGDVRANNQVSGAGMTNPGLTSSSGVTPGTLKTHDRGGQIDNIVPANELSGSAASCQDFQTRDWGANTKIVGEVTIKNNCIVTISGDIWITGKLTLENSARIVVANSLSPVIDGTLPTVMVDGDKALFKNSSMLQSNASNTGMQIINYWSKASCSTDDPGCTVTGNELYDSRDEVTIELDNSASGPHSIFYARWTQVTIQNSGNIGALIGQRVQLKNSGTISFGTSVSGGGVTNWIIDGYRRSY